MKRLPPLNSLRAFEAAARHLGFKKAAEELNVSPAAVSQHVRALEAELGQPLFRRMTREVALTPAGRRGLARLAEAFRMLRAGADAMRPDERLRYLTVSVPPTLGAKWLVPRLDHFRLADPGFDIRLDATDTLVDFSTDDVDVALRYGRGDYPGLVSERIVAEVAFPVCGPALLAGERGLRAPADLAGHTLLHVQRKLDDDAAPSRRMWLKAAGLDGIDAERGPRFTIESLALESAIAGHGVALASGMSVGEDLAAGRLVRPFPPSGHDATSFSYHLVYPETRRGDPRLQAFRDWVFAEMSGRPAT
ncbi:transcriptional regulator GcvA [Lutibaculum baratangense]|uniref:Transcriptional regulator, LysR family protein n=1 Tax=Lutibaculum baratangense AMV1 TaxID=631454 RepID=V4RKM0_9HYPH|nr:transcriptional regulator GcvA [Lutibaculum baratangense]ESR26601.1 transcriptional regulator, LysR family protein [Lutibaculum baratangense AMV1]